MLMARRLDRDQVNRALHPEVVSVHVPVEVLWDFERVTDLRKEILGKLGCLGCTSGFDIRFRVPEWEYAAGDLVDVKEQALRELVR
jgi:hypothetical protein